MKFLPLQSYWFSVAVVIIQLYSPCVKAQQSPYSFPPDKQLTQFTLDNYTTDNGLPLNGLNRIHQARNGYLWIVSYDGIICFDGFDFELYNKTNTPVFQSNAFGALTEDNDGNLWFASSGDGLIQYKDGKFYTYGKEKGITHLFETVYIDEQNRVWSGTQAKGCFYFHNNEFYFPSYCSAFSNVEVRVITGDKKGTMYFGTDGKGLYKYADSTLKHYGTKEGLTDEALLSLYVDNNNVFIGTQSGFFTLKNNSIQRHKDMDDLIIQKILPTADGNLWFSTVRGLYRKRYDNNTFQHIGLEDGLLHDYLSDQIMDNEGNLWFALKKGGLVRLKDENFTTYDTKIGMAGKIVYAVCEDKNGAVLVGFDNGAVNKIENDVISTLSFRTNVKGLQIRHMYKDSRNNLWISFYAGLLKIEPSGNETWLNASTGFPASLIRLVYEDRQHNLWVGTRNKGLIKVGANGTHKIFDMNNGLSANLVMSIDEDHDGNLLIGSVNGGLHILSNDTISKTYNVNNGLVNNVIFNTYTDNEGIVWVASAGGVSRIDQEKITNYSIKDGLASDTPYDIVEDNEGNFWMPFNTGVMKIKKQLLNDFAVGKTTKITCNVYDKNDGIPSEGFISVAQSIKTADGKIWLPAQNGIVMVNPSDLKYNNLPPPVYIEHFFADNDTIPLQQGINIEAGKQRFTFKYTAICLHTPQKVRFKYKLEGFDKNWTETNYLTRTISYTNLANGHYTFRVMACNNDGVWNETGDTLNFKIQPYWYQTLLFRVLALVVIVSLVFLFYKMRIRQLKNRQKELEIIVQQRTFEVFQQKEEIKTALELVNKQKEEISVALGIVNQQKEEISVTLELVNEQKEKLEQSHNNVQMLSEIGKEITSNLNVETVVETVYQHVNRLMDATVFSIGVFQPAKGIMVFAKEENVMKEPYFYSLSDKDRLAVICFEQKQEIFINDMDVEYTRYMSQRKKPLSGNYVSSIIYLPLMLKNDCVGTISVQSYHKSAYTHNDVTLLRNIAIYASIALENSSTFRKIDQQRQEIEKSHRQITASINYAKRIQTAVLPSSETVQQLFLQHFILFKPRDIVSGDFYFVKQIEDTIFIAAADCTGHGVPGAFMSILGIAILNEIIRNHDVINAAQILNELRQEIKHSLQQTGVRGEQQDGMDIAFCAINTDTLQMSFAGAHNPCWVFRSDVFKGTSDKLKVISEELQNNTEQLITHHSQLITLEGDNQPVGVYIKEKTFTEHTLQLQKGDTFYIFSDGYYSQLDESKGLPLGTKKFKEILFDSFTLPLEEQKQILDHRFNQRKASEPQTDDVLVVGVRI